MDIAVSLLSWLRTLGRYGESSASPVESTHHFRSMERIIDAKAFQSLFLEQISIDVPKSLPCICLADPMRKNVHHCGATRNILPRPTLMRLHCIPEE